MDKLIEIVNKAIADYGFRQIVQWSPEDVISQWRLSSQEADVLKGPIKVELDRMPIPVEPKDIDSEKNRLAEILKEALD